MERVSKYNGIQALRFIAALLVVVTHATFYVHERLDKDLPVWSLGAIGVDIFFVISGFVMMVTAGSFIGEDGWKRFCARRVLRIVPLYWIATSIKLVTLLTLPSVVLHAELNPLNVVLSYLFLPSTNVDGRFEPLLGVGWTLIFEMFFYGIFALALALRVKILPFVGAVLAVCCLISVFRTPDWPAATMYFSPNVAFFFVGMAFAALTRKHDHKMLFISGLIGVCITAAWVVFFDGEILAKAKSPLGALFASSFVLLFIGLEPWIGNRIPRSVLFMGEASYALYLFHPLIAPAVPQVFSKLGVQLPTLSVLLSILIAVFASAIVHKWIEVPITKFLRPLIPYAGGAKRP